MTSPLNLPAPGRCQSLYFVLIDFAETYVFVKQSLGPFHCGPFRLNMYYLTYLGHPFSRSYGVNLPSSLTTALSSALEYSSHLPVSVCGTVRQYSPVRRFSWQPDYSQFMDLRPPIRASKLRKCGFAYTSLLHT